MIGRRQFVSGAAAVMATTIAGPVRAAPLLDWTTAPEAAGFAPELDSRLDKLIADKRVWNPHSVLVLRKGRVAQERYFTGEENNWGKISQTAFGPETLHNLYSVSKSVVGLLYGIALGDGKVPPPEAPLYAQFPEYADLLAADPRKAERTVAHALTMSLALQWDEINVPYDSPRNDEIGMEMAKDRYRFILERPVVGAPGKRWHYSGGATALLGRLIARGSGQSLPDFARQALFDPLGIGPTEWIVTTKTSWLADKLMGDGEPAAASGLRRTPRDLARIGQLVLDRGKAGDRQVVPATWLDACFTPQLAADEQRRYGYQWYVGDMEFRSHSGVQLEHWVGCFGNGGQRLFVFPELELVVVTTFGNFQPNQWMPPIRVLREAVLPSLL